MIWLDEHLGGIKALRWIFAFIDKAIQELSQHQLVDIVSEAFRLDKETDTPRDSKEEVPRNTNLDIVCEPKWRNTIISPA